MTPGARIAAAIGILDAIRAGAPAEQALTGWARASRFAGSGDRAAVRDHVFDVLRSRRTLGDGDGRSLMLQLAMRKEWDIAALFSGEGHAPAKPDPSEIVLLDWPPGPIACDIPDWLWPLWEESLGADALHVAHVLQERAPVFLRVNLRRGTRAQAAAALAAEGIETAPHPQLASALQVTGNARRVKTARAYQTGLVELQDAASQWAVGLLPLAQAERVLDYCAGGGGKALAIADLCTAKVHAHDIAPARMRDLPARAARAGVTISMVESAAVADHAPYDLVFCDAPCSGSGTWRRTPDAKWRLTQGSLDQLLRSQDDVLAAVQALVGSDGVLAYATCSVLTCENDARIAAFCSAFPDWGVVFQQTRLPDAEGDGFFLAILRRNL
ncbi:RsmB/NOP family class I SAM-dependent RNA methyltransferase [Yoonia sp.]|uniref:RsmB/NOP family class I SAM-dependent RNA methyltransferase n=1 Tax=Yoonia sp. TaxID=2212373 RepID=UPI002FDAEA02